MRAEIADLITDILVQEARLRGVLITGGDTAGVRAAIRAR
jgi:CHASE3 domain sensor protein